MSEIESAEEFGNRLASEWNLRDDRAIPDFAADIIIATRERDAAVRAATIETFVSALSLGPIPPEGQAPFASPYVFDRGLAVMRRALAAKVGDGE